MIGGLHAETTIFATIEETSRLALSARWPWFGRPGSHGSGEVTLTGSQPRPFRILVREARRRGRTVLCQLELYEVDPLDGVRPLLRVDIMLVREVSRTKLTLTGSTAADLATLSPTRSVDSRRLGNEYARSLVGQIAQYMEHSLAGSSGDTTSAEARDQ